MFFLGRINDYRIEGYHNLILNLVPNALNGTYYRYPEDAERAKDALYRLRKVLEKVWEMY